MGRGTAGPGSRDRSRRILRRIVAMTVARLIVLHLPQGGVWSRGLQWWRLVPRLMRSFRGVTQIGWRTGTSVPVVTIRRMVGGSAGVEVGEVNT